MPFVNVKMIEGRTTEQKITAGKSHYRINGRDLRVQIRNIRWWWWKKFRGIIGLVAVSWHQIEWSIVTIISSGIFKRCRLNIGLLEI